MELFQDPLLTNTADAGPGIIAPEPAGAGLLPGGEGGGELSSGIGLAPPVTASTLTTQPVNANRRAEAFAQLSPGQKFFTAVGELGAGLQGKSSPFDARLKQDREERHAKLQEFKVQTDSLQDGVKMARVLTGDARKKFVEQYAQQLDGVGKGLGDTFRTLLEQPDSGAALLKYADKSPTLKRAIEMDPSGATALKLMASPDALKTISGEIDSSMMPVLLKKGQLFKLGWQDLVPKEMAEKFNRDGQITASELMEANQWIKANKPDMKDLVLNDDEIQIIGRNSDAFYGALGIVSPKTEQEILRERGKVDARDKAPTTRTITQGSQEIQQEWRDGKWQEVGRGPKFKPGDGGDQRLTPTTISVNGKNIAALVDKYGNYFDANTRQALTGGIGPQLSSQDEERNRTLTGRRTALENTRESVNMLENLTKNNPQAIAGLFSGPARAIEYVAGSLNPKGDGTTPASQGLQLRDSIIAGMQNFSKLSNAERERIENALQIGSGGNPRNLPLAITLLRNAIEKEEAELGAGRARPEPGKGGPSVYASANDVREAFRKGTITRDQAKKELKNFGFDN